MLNVNVNVNQLTIKKIIPPRLNHTENQQKGQSPLSLPEIWPEECVEGYSALILSPYIDRINHIWTAYLSLEVFWLHQKKK